MKLFKGFALLGAFLVLAGCSASSSGGSTGGGGGGSGNGNGGNPIIGGDASSANGKAWIAAIKGKLYDAKEEPAGSGIWVADETRPVPVSDNGDIAFDEAYVFAGAPNVQSAYYYREKLEYDGGVWLDTKEGFWGFIIEGNIVYSPTLKKQGEDIAKELGLGDDQSEWSKQPEKLRKFYQTVYSAENIDLSKPDKGDPPIFVIKP